MIPRLSLATLLLALPLALAQDQGANGWSEAAKGPNNIPTAEDKPGDESQPNYPQWVTNDYPCVIGCCQGFNGADISRDPNPDLEGKTRQCVLDTCNKDSQAENLYQMTYIIQMFYHTGSIYECDGKPCTPAGDNAGNTTTASDGVDHTASPAVAIAGVTNAATDAGATTTVETAVASDATSSDTVSAEAASGSSSSGNGAGRTSWGMGLALAAGGVAFGAGVGGVL